MAVRWSRVWSNAAISALSSRCDLPLVEAKHAAVVRAADHLLPYSVFNGGMTEDLPQLVSVGYEGKDVDALISDLEHQKVGTLVDVRLNPISRKPGLSKRKLADALALAGIKYVHFRELGNPKDNRDGFRAGEQSALNRFRSLLLGDGALQALGHVTELLDNEVVALLCFEREHTDCHRGLVAEALVDRTPTLSVRTA